MNPSDKLELIRAIEENESSHKRRSVWIAWGSVGLASVVLIVMILAGSRELNRIEEQVGTKQRELEQTNKALGDAETKLDDAKTKLDKVLELTAAAQGNLQNEEGRPLSARSVESAVDALSEVRNVAAPDSPDPPGPGREVLIQQLFDSNASVRVQAYNALLPRYRNDPTLVPELLKVASQNSKNANGIYNTLVVLSHMNADRLTPYAGQIRTFAEASRSIGPRVSERADTLRRRIPD